MRPLKQKQVDALLASLQNEKEYVFLDTVRSDSENRHSYLFTEPQSRLDFFPGEDPLVFIAAMEEALGAGYYLAGWLSYEFGYLLEDKFSGLVRGGGAEPLASFGVFREPYRIDHETGTSDLLCPDVSSGLSGFSLKRIRTSQGQEDYLAAIHRVKEYIAAGDTYQVNYTLKLLFDFSGSPEAFYRELRRNQSVAYGALVRLGGEHILSLSPELFFRVEEDFILVRPMKGTMARGRDWSEDQERWQRLREDPKNRCENVMIVDLLRNDLARLSHQIGGAKVVTRSLFDVEQYESVLQMTSTIYAQTEGSVLSRLGLLEVLKPLFPCGSVTGAPKIRTMEIIQKLEDAPRGVYTGAIGYLSPSGGGVFNVPIRTIRLRGEKGEMGIGSGIVHDSDPEQEWQECLLKANFLTKSVPEFVLIETLLWELDGGYFLLDGHLKRLEKSALYFSFAYSRREVLEALELLVEEKAFGGQSLRVRLTLAKDGLLALTYHACESPTLFSLPPSPHKDHDSLPAIRVSESKVDSASPWFFHKTSQRGLFDQEFAKAGQCALFDCIFVNGGDELTEGCISNLIVYLEGRYVTPPVSSGLLAGTMRAKLLGEQKVKLWEEVLGREDLYRAEALFCCNSVRGVVQVRLVEE